MCIASDRVKKDGSLILDAVRRLKEGLWNLQDEDSDVACYLLPQIRAALSDHILLEELWIFPYLTQCERKKHAGEHAEMSALLWALETSLKSGEAEKFRALLQLLGGLIETHHSDALLAGCGEPPPSEPYVKRLLSRSEQSTLEKI